MKRALVLALAAGCACATTASGQSFGWASVGGGEWNQPLNWSPFGVPNGPTATAAITLAGTYQIDLNGATTLLHLSKANANATLHFPDGTSMHLKGGAHTNNGPIVIGNGGGGNWTYLQATGPVTFDGIGSILLDANPGSLDTAFLSQAAGGDSFTFGSGQTVRGSGRIFARVINQGVIQADLNGRSLQLVTEGKTNNNLIRAINGGILGVINCGVTQPANGVVRADGGQVHLDHMSLTGGALESINGGVTTVTNGTVTFDGVTVSGPLQVNDAMSLHVAPAGLVNNGTITVGTSGSNWTILRLFGNTAIGGAGTIALNANPNNLDTAFIVSSAAGDVGTIGSGQTVRGNGRIFAKVVNQGLIQADLNGRSLQLVTEGKTNNNLIRAINGGIIGIINCGVTQGPGAVIRADGGQVHLDHMSLTGGALESINGGMTTVTNGTVTFDGVTVSGPLQVNDAMSLHVAPAGLVNNGTITVGTSGGNWTILRLFGNTAIGGAGTIALNANPNNLDTAFIVSSAAGDVGTIGSGQTVRGNGRIFAKVVNQGLIQADLNGRSLQLVTEGKTNNNLIRAINGGIIGIINCGVTQGPGAVIRADGSQVHLDHMSLTGGALESINGGMTTVTNGTVTFDGVNVSGPLQVNDAMVLAVGPSGVQNNGHIRIGNGAGGAWTVLRFDADGTLSGQGTVELAANPNNFDTAFLNAPVGTITGTIGPNQTVKGNGRFYVSLVNQGTVAPGASVGNLQAISPYTQAASGTLEIEIGGTGAGQFDVLSGPAPKTLAGTLKLSLVNGFTPALGNTFTIVTGSSVSGQFATVTGPALAGGRHWSVEYAPDAVTVAVRCYADCNGDGMSNIADFGCFQTRFATAHPYADCNGDGMLNLADFGCFQTRFALGCQ